MDVEAWRLGFDIFQFVLTCSVALYAFVATRQRATRKRVEELGKDHGERLGCHAKRITRLETELPHLPTNEAINRLAERIADLHGDFKGLHAEVSGMKEMREMMQRQIGLMDTFLRKNGG